MHPVVLVLRQALEPTPFHGKVWLVGGAVRDQLLGQAPGGDLDLVVDGDAPALARWLFEAGLSEIPPVIYPRFGTALIRISGVEIELVTARRESYRARSRKPLVEPATLLEDALRRDFTVNSLLQSIETGEIRDLLGSGLADLERKQLRTPREPKKTFDEDPLRILRAVRFRHKLGFSFAPELESAIRECAPNLAHISAERIRDEFLKMLVHSTAASALGELQELGLLATFAPELQAMVGVEQGKWHHVDVWHHSLLVVSGVSSGLELRLAALLHDVGKPPTRSIDAQGDTRFFSHEVVGAAMAVRWLQRMRISGATIETVRLLVRNHMRLGSSPAFSASAARRLLRDLEGHEEELLELVQADANALRRGVKKLDLGPIRAQLDRVRAETPRQTLESPLSGQEIMEHLQIPAGKRVGQIKARLTEMVLEGQLAPQDKDAAYRLLSELA